MDGKYPSLTAHHGLKSGWVQRIPVIRGDETLAVSIKFERKSDENYVVTLSSDEDVSLLYRCQVDAAKFGSFSLSNCTYADFPQYLCEVIASVVNKRNVNASSTTTPSSNSSSSSDQQFYATILATSSDSADLLVTERARDRVVQTQKLRLPMVICNDREHKQYLLEVVEGYKSRSQRLSADFNRAQKQNCELKQRVADMEQREVSLRKELDSFRSLLKHYESLLQQLLQQQQLFNFSSVSPSSAMGPSVSSIFSLPAQGLPNSTHSLALSGILANLAVKSAQNSVVSAASLLDSTISAVVNGNSNACHNNNNNINHQPDDGSSVQSSPASTPKLTNGFCHHPPNQQNGSGASGMISQSILSSDRKTLLRGSAKRKQPSPKSLQASSSASHSPGSPTSPDSLPIEAPSSGPELNMESKNFASELHAARLLMEANFGGGKFEKFEPSSVESTLLDDSMMDDVKTEGDAESGGGSPSSTSLFSSGSAGGGGDFLNHRDIVMFFRCQICSETAPGAEELKLHMMGCHVDGSRAICSCADGCFESANVDDLERHLAGHASRVYACRYCGKENTRPHYLKIHIRTHTGEKPYNCKYCGRAFADGSTWRRHERVHTGEKPYQCPICGRRIARRDNVKIHMRSHLRARGGGGGGGGGLGAKLKIPAELEAAIVQSGDFAPSPAVNMQ